MLAEGAVDVGLVAAAALGAGFEPCDEVGVEAEGDLPLDGAVEGTAAGPFDQSRTWGMPLVSIWSSGSSSRALQRRHVAFSVSSVLSLFHKPSSRDRSLCGR